MAPVSVTWFGATTFRLELCGLVIFLDTWLDRLSYLPRFLSIDEVEHADYVFISHAHFDHLPGANRLARKTGAVVVANGEAINLLRAAGVPEDQLIPVAGGERIPLFTLAVREQARRGQCDTMPAPPAAPPIPHPSLSVMEAHIWPSLHCLMPPGEHPEFIDTGRDYRGVSHSCQCTFDITRGMKYGLMNLDKLLPKEALDKRILEFVDYINDTDKNLLSSFDGGQIMVNFVVNERAILWNAHLGAYEGIIASITPKPNVAILGIAGRANHNGRPWDGSAADFALQEVRWLQEPRTVIWCLHDQSPLKPFYIDTGAATKIIETQTSSRVKDLKAGVCSALNI